MNRANIIDAKRFCCCLLWVNLICIWICCVLIEMWQVDMWRIAWMKMLLRSNLRRILRIVFMLCNTKIIIFRLANPSHSNKNYWRNNLNKIIWRVKKILANFNHVTFKKSQHKILISLTHKNIINLFMCLQSCSFLLFLPFLISFTRVLQNTDFENQEHINRKLKIFKIFP